MDCKDLMVGDWVICNHYQDMPFTKQFRVADFAKGEYVFCEPIPLTEEILVKNGFKGNHLDGYYYWQDADRIELDGNFGYHGIVINYVHQLQHLLRLRGIEKEIEI